MTGDPSGDTANDDTERVWLVERSVDDRNLVTLVYASLDGTQCWTRQLSSPHLASTEVTAAKRVQLSKLDPVDDPAVRERYARAAKRVRSEHEPGDDV